MNQRWVYHVIEIKLGLLGRFKTEKVQEELNRQGMLGWELVNLALSGPLAPAVAVFKKPL